MRKLGLSAQKTLYIRELAKHTKKGRVVFETLPELEDAAVIEHLTQVKGIGVWTAQMFLMFALRREDVLPVGDLGIRTAMKKAYELEDLPKPAEMEQIAAPWKPIRRLRAGICGGAWRMGGRKQNACRRASPAYADGIPSAPLRRQACTSGLGKQRYSGMRYR